MPDTVDEIAIIYNQPLHQSSLNICLIAFIEDDTSVCHTLANTGGHLNGGHLNFKNQCCADCLLKHGHGLSF